MEQTTSHGPKAPNVVERDPFQARLNALPLREKTCLRDGRWSWWMEPPIAASTATGARRSAMRLYRVPDERSPKPPCRQSDDEDSSDMIATAAREDGPNSERHRAGPRQSLLSLAPAPVFAVMALLNDISPHDISDMVCSGAHIASPLTGMVPMYLLMTIVHAAPWWKLLENLLAGDAHRLVQISHDSIPTPVR